MSITLKQTIYWVVAALALLMLADPLPDVATMFVVLLIAGVLLTHWSDYAGYLDVGSLGKAGGAYSTAAPVTGKKTVLS